MLYAKFSLHRELTDCRDEREDKMGIETWCVVSC